MGYPTSRILIGNNHAPSRSLASFVRRELEQTVYYIHDSIVSHKLTDALALFKSNYTLILYLYPIVTKYTNKL